jgi:hypothetical protein
VLTDSGRVPIGQRAWIGDGRHGASISPDGTIDWFCSGGLAAPPDFWRLLDETGPALRVGPVREGGSARRHLPASVVAYRPATNVVDTVMEAAGGRRVSVTDFMPWPGPGQEVPGGIVRIIRALSGPVEVEVEVMAGPPRRPGGSTRTVAPSPLGLDLDGLMIGCPVRFEPAPVDRDTPRWRASTRLDTGEELAVSAGFRDPVSGGAARRMLEQTETAWRAWLSLAVFGGPHRDAVERALLAIRSVVGPGGAPHGSGTTSLPRRVGSERSADDRWVNVAGVARAVAVLAALGLAEDAEAAEEWLRRMAETAHLPWPSWLDGDGQPVPEAEQQPLVGWQRSEPVLYGRRPAGDVGLIGSVTAALGTSTSGPGGRREDPGALSAAFDRLAEATDRAADDWGSADTGPWGIVEPVRLHTAGRLGVWSALDRMARVARAANPLDLRAATWQQEARSLLHWMEENCVAADGGLRMDGRPGAPDETDAALLAVTWTGPWPLADPLVGATVDRVVERLTSSSLLYRYSERVADEQAGPDHPDVEASLMAVRALARLGRWDEAHERMETVTSFAGPSTPGLLAETADPLSGQVFGNFPATRAHLALVEAALSLAAGPV